MKLTDIFRKKSDIERQIAARKAAALNAERALSLCDKVEAELPARIAALESIATPVAFSPHAQVEDFTGRHDLHTQRKQLLAARSLMADLPLIRAHWGKVRDSLSN